MESLLNPVELVRKPPANNARTRPVTVAEPDAESGRQAMDGELERVVAASNSEVLPGKGSPCQGCF